MLKEGKQTIFYAFNRLNWELVSAHNPALQKYKTEPEAPWSPDLLWNVVVTTERESDALLFLKSHLPSQCYQQTLELRRAIVFSFSQLL